jgi:S1-C subfamily serine protease
VEERRKDDMDHTSLAQLSTELSALVETAGASLVTVRSGHGASSATVVAAGRLVTSHHGLDPDSDTAHILVGDRSHDARVLGRDPVTDLALLGVEQVDLPPIATTTDLPRVGALAISVGRAWNRLLSGLGVVHDLSGPVPRRHGGRLESLIRTTIVPYPGFSGGPLVDATGKMIGLATAGIHRGVGAALPVATVLRTADLLASHGRVRRGFVGVTTLPVALPEAQRGPGGAAAGLLITSIAPDGPSARAGLLVGDIVLAMSGQPISSPDDLMTLLAADVIGQPMPTSILRGAQALSVTVTIGERGRR